MIVRATIAGLVCASLALSACSPKVVRHEVPVVVSRAVAQPCALPRPSKPAPIADWSAKDARQKAATIGAKAIEWRNYGEALDAATAACPEN